MQVTDNNVHVFYPNFQYLFCQNVFYITYVCVSPNILCSLNVNIFYHMVAFTKAVWVCTPIKASHAMLVSTRATSNRNDLWDDLLQVADVLGTNLRSQC